MSRLPKIRFLFLGVFLISILSTPVFADTIAVIGTGRVANVLGPAFAELGHTIVYGSREPAREDVRALVERTTGDASAVSPAEAASQGSLVLLAVNWENAEEVVSNLGDLSGKIIIDPINPVGDSGHVFNYGNSAAENIQSWAPNASVVKAFNALGAPIMADPSSSGGPVSIPLASDDPAAKQKVAELVEGIGLHPVDVGPLINARVVEGMLLLLFAGRSNDAPFNYYLRPMPQ